MPLDLEKREKVFTLSLEKQNVSKITVQVGFCADISGSMSNLYDNGTMQTLVERLTVVGIKFDDNGQIDTWAFNESVRELDNINEANCETFVNKKFGRIGGGTNYSPALEEAREHYAPQKKGLFGKVEVQPPAYLMFLTDGEAGDSSETDRLLAKMESEGIYIQFVAIGTGSKFEFLQEMADKYSNIGYSHFEKLNKTTDEEIYDSLVNPEFVGWMKSKYPTYIK
jgi:hypothetical protein